MELCFNDGENRFLKSFSVHLNNDYYTFSDRLDKVGKHYANFTDVKEDDDALNEYSVDIKSANSHAILHLYTI